MITITTTYNYTLHLGNDCTLYLNDARGKRLFESNPNDTLNTIHEKLRKRGTDHETTHDAYCYMFDDIVLALDKVEGFAGGIHPETVARFNEMLDAPSWRLLQWLR